MECVTGKIYTCDICGKVFVGDWRKLNGHRNSAHNPEANRKGAVTKTGIPLSEEHKRKIGITSAKVPRTIGWRAKISYAMSKDGLNLHRKYQPESQKEKNRQSMKILANTEAFQAKRRAKNVGQTKENSSGRLAQSEKIKGINNPMANPEHLKKAMRNSAKKNGDRGMNKPEGKLLQILDSLYPNEWRFVGNGEVIIAGKCPDFININGQKKCIELFGDHWHKDDNPQDRIDVFTPYGYKTLVVWEKELKDVDHLKETLGNFYNV